MISGIGKSTLNLIARHGRTFTYTQVLEGSYDLETSSAALTKTDIAVKAYKTRISYRESQSPNLIADKTSAFLIAGLNLTITPKVGDYIVDGLDTYTVLSAMPIEYQGGIAMWRLTAELS